MAFNTGNSLGSTDPRDLSDNAENLDRFANGTDPAYNNRLSKSRKSLAGMESDFATDQSERATTFANFLASSGYEFLGEYAGGIEVTEYNQIIRESGEFWRAAASTSLPYTTTGAGMPESGAFVAVGDAALRQEIGSGIFRADSLANLESTNGRFDGDAARLVSGTGRDGDFRWDASDLSSTLVLASATSDSVDDTTDTINDAGHPFSDGDGVITQTAVNGLTAHTVYWVINSTSGSYQLSATFGGGAVDLTGTTNVTIDHLLDPLQGVYVTPASDKTGGSGAWVRGYQLDVYAAWFGCQSGGVSDQTSAISAAVNILPAWGGTVVIPSGQLFANLRITKNNVTLRAGANANVQTGDVAIVPFISTEPALQIGDGSERVTGFQASDISLHGDENTNDKGLLLLGAYRCFFDNVNVVGFAEYCVKATSTASAQTAYIFFDGFEFTNSIGNCLEVVYGGSFTAAIFLSNGNIAETTSVGGRGIYLDESTIFISNVWHQAQADQGIRIVNGGEIYASNVTIDSDNSNDVLVELDVNGYVMDYIHGTCNIDGKVKFLDGTTADMGGDLIRTRSMASFPFVMGDISFSDTTKSNTDQHTYDQAVRIYNAGNDLILDAASDILLTPDSGKCEVRSVSTAPQFQLNSTASGHIGAMRLFSNGVVEVQAPVAVGIDINSVRTWQFESARLIPVLDNDQDIGLASNRVKEIFAVNGTINTSDEREKQQVRGLTDAEARVARNLKNSIRAFKWNDAVDKKGSEARIHFGLIAQEVGAAFMHEGLNPEDYGMFCYDEWEADLDEDGNEISAAGNRYGIRYDELMAFIISAI